MQTEWYGRCQKPCQSFGQRKSGIGSNLINLAGTTHQQQTLQFLKGPFSHSNKGTFFVHSLPFYRRRLGNVRLSNLAGARPLLLGSPKPPQAITQDNALRPRSKCLPSRATNDLACRMRTGSTRTLLPITLATLSHSLLVTFLVVILLF